MYGRLTRARRIADIWTSKSKQNRDGGDGCDHMGKEVAGVATTGDGEKERASEGKEGENPFGTQGCTCHVTHVRYSVIGDTYRSVEVRVNVQLFAIAPGEDATGREASGPKLRSGNAFTRFPRRWLPILQLQLSSSLLSGLVAGVPLSASDPGRSTAFLISLPLARKGIDNWNTCASWRRRQRGEGLRERLGPRGT